MSGGELFRIITIIIITITIILIIIIISIIKIMIIIIKDGTNIVHEEEEGANTAGPDGGWDDLNDDCEEQREPGFS